MSELKLYLLKDGKSHIWDFTASAEIGAKNNNIDTYSFYDFNNIPENKYNVVCGSVESVKGFLTNLNIDIPKAIDVTVLPFYLTKRKFKIDILKNSNKYTPTFVKPCEEVKAFNAFIQKSSDDYLMYTQEVDKNILCLFQDIINIKSEWRCYVMEGKIIKCCNYLGDALMFPNKDFLLKALSFIENTHLKRAAYSIDIGILENDENSVIEIQDGWAIGNYGLDPEDYFNFIKKRWLEIVK